MGLLLSQPGICSGLLNPDVHALLAHEWPCMEPEPPRASSIPHHPWHPPCLSHPTPALCHMRNALVPRTRATASPSQVQHKAEDAKDSADIGLTSAGHKVERTGAHAKKNVGVGLI